MSNDGWGKPWPKLTEYKPVEPPLKLDMVGGSKPLSPSDAAKIANDGWGQPTQNDGWGKQSAGGFEIIPAPAKPLAKQLAEQNTEIDKQVRDWGKPVFVGIDKASGSDHSVIVVSHGDKLLFSVEIKKIKITIPDAAGWPKTVEADQIEDLAIHLNVNNPELLSVTHLPTLKQIDSVLPDEIEHNQLLRWCAKVQATMQDDWQRLRALTPKTWYHMEDVRDRIEGMCKSTSI